MGKMIEFEAPGGDTLKGYHAFSGEGLPGVVVIQEWWGLNDQICGIADRLARTGYNALAPDLYHGRVTQSVDEASHLMSGLDFPGATHQDIRGAVRYLKGNTSRVAAVGYCMGGALALAGAVHVPELDAAVCYYGIPPEEFAAPKDIVVPVQCHFAERDDWCTPQAVAELEAKLTNAKIDFELYRYEAAHAFFNEQVDAYDVVAADSSWKRMMRFFEARL